MITVKTPRFYINIMEWLAHNNVIDINSQWATLPVNPKKYIDVSYDIGNYWGDLNPHPNLFLAILGHNLGWLGGGDVYTYFGLRLGENNYGDTGNGLVNASEFWPLGGFPSSHNGFSIVEYPNLVLDEQFNLEISILDYDHPGGWDEGVDIGSIVLGNYYDMKNAPNLSLTMSREYGSTKEFTTYNGSSVSNTMWNKAPAWGKSAAWQLSRGSSPPTFGLPPNVHKLAPSGRRTWSLKFSYMSAADLWGPNQSLSYYLETMSGIETNDLVYADSSPAVLVTGQQPTGFWCGESSNLDPHCWTNELGIFATKAIALDDIFTEYPELEGKLNFIRATFPAVEGTSGYTATATFFEGIGWTGLLASLGLHKDRYYILGIVSGVDPFTSGLFHQTHTPTDFDGFQQNILTDDNFFSQVWHQTEGGTIPFIFQPDNSNFSPDQLAICRFKSNSLKATQSSFNTYDVSVIIEEVW